MNYFGLSNAPRYLTESHYLPMARVYWGTGPLPDGSEIIGGYSDSRRAGALIQMPTGLLCCGNDGALSNVPPLKKGDRHESD